MNIRPIEGNIHITSKYGSRIDPKDRTPGFHNGIDIGCNIGTPLVAIEDGKLVINKTNGGGVHKGYGHYLVIEHNGFCTLYGHMLGLSRLNVGQIVRKGDVVGYSGNTGKSTGPHLHFEIRQGSYGRSFWQKDSKGKYINSIDPQKFQLKERWKEILRKKTSRAEDWIRFVEKNRNDVIGRFLPELIEKIEEK